MKFGRTKRVYLDAAAAHPVRRSALRAFTNAVAEFGNPSAPHEEGRAAADILEQARRQIAFFAGAKPEAVIFTAGATESNALAIEGHIRARIAAGADPRALHILYLPTQHASVVETVAQLAAEGIQIEEIPLIHGDIDLEALRSVLRPETALITLDLICGETGTRFDTRGVAQLIAGTQTILHVDATQAPLVENMERTRLAADLVSFDAQKIGGVRGIGVLIAPLHVPLLPVIHGGGQERGLRSGTPSPALAAAFARACADAADERVAFAAAADRKKDALAQQILTTIPNTVVNGGTNSAPHILNISFLGRDTEYLAALLNEAGYAVATRSACETDADGSRVVRAYTGDDARAASTLRISFSKEISDHDTDAFLRALTEAVRFIDASQDRH